MSATLGATVVTQCLWKIKLPKYSYYCGVAFWFCTMALGVFTKQKNQKKENEKYYKSNKIFNKIN